MTKDRTCCIPAVKPIRTCCCSFTDEPHSSSCTKPQDAATEGERGESPTLPTDHSAPARATERWSGYDSFVGKKFLVGYLLDTDAEPDLREVGTFNCSTVAGMCADALNVLAEREAGTAGVAGVAGVNEIELIMRALTKACEAQGLVVDLSKFIRSLNDWGVYLSSLADLDPPVCRLQFPDGSVPCSVREAAERWHEIAEDRGSAMRRLDEEIRRLDRELLSARADVAAMTELIAKMEGRPVAVRVTGEHAEVLPGTAMGLEPIQPGDRFVPVAEIEVPASGAPEPDVAAMTEQLGAPFKFTDRLRAKAMPHLGALAILSQTLGADGGWGITVQQIGATPVSVFSADELEPIPDLPLVTLDNGDKVNMATFGQSLVDEAVAEALGKFEKLRRSQPVDSTQKQED